jgi:CheY-like chemotaxis protein
MGASPPSQGKRVLVVEDTADARELLVELLTAEGYEVEAACDGAEALRLLRGGRPFDLVLLDLMMPVMDGIELIDALKRSGGLPAPVVAMSAFERFRKDVGGLGARAFVGKPVDIDHLLATVERHAGTGERPPV